jgi:hypothetical protein
VGVSWNKRSRKWIATIRHDGKQQHLGNFDDEREAARAFDTAARRLGGEDSHGGRAGGKQWLRLNFPSKREAARAVDTAARRLRGDDAHGGRAGTNWLRLNFPSKREVGRAKALGMPAAR